MTHDEQIQHAHELFRTWFQLALGRMATLWADQGLSLPQIRLLFVLAHFGPATINGLAERLQNSQSATSLLVDRLVQAHLAERTDDPADRRRAIVRLTEEGEALMGRRRAGQQALLSWLGGLDETHLTMVIETLTAILNIAQGDLFFEGDSQNVSSKQGQNHSPGPSINLS